jgi:UDP-N-acetyl-D-mannosaminuronate dehydrogenase
MAVQINDAMPLASVSVLENMFPDGLSGRKILILGASYREDIGDTRQSPSATFAAELVRRSAIVEFVDPLVERIPELSVPLHRILPAADGVDAVVLAVAHEEFKALDLKAWAGQARPIVFDANGVLNSRQLGELNTVGFKVAGIGRALK